MTHRHLNEATGRVNSFWPSICRLKKQGEPSFRPWDCHVHRNVNAAYRRSEGQLKWFGEDELRIQMVCFGSSDVLRQSLQLWANNAPVKNVRYERSLSASALLRRHGSRLPGPHRPKFPEIPKSDSADVIGTLFLLLIGMKLWEMAKSMPRSRQCTEADDIGPEDFENCVSAKFNGISISIGRRSNQLNGGQLFG
jgi:hypothetical protein